jgi:hypothetical protein
MAAPEDREQLLRHGFVIIRGLLSDRWLEDMRALTEALIVTHKALLPEDAQADPRPGCFAGTLSPYAEPLASAIDADTARWVELWSSPESPLHAVSSGLLGVEDAALASMEVLCQDPPHGPGDRLAGGRLVEAPAAPGSWHRDFYPSRCAPLESWAADAADGGPTCALRCPSLHVLCAVPCCVLMAAVACFRYIQWNVALYDDDVLHVVPDSHDRPPTPAQSACLHSGGLGAGRGAFAGMLPGTLPVLLAAGDGVAYINQIIHRASHYNGNSNPSGYGHCHRRTVHGGYFAAAGYPWPTPFAAHLTPASQATFTRWSRRHLDNLAQEEATLRAVIEANPEVYRSNLQDLVAGHRGPAGCRHATILLSKAARRIFFYHHPELDQNTQEQLGTPGGEWTDYCDVRALQDPALWSRFTRAEAQTLWARMAHIDAAMREPEPPQGTERESFQPALPLDAGESVGVLNWQPGFQGGPTEYRFHSCPDVAEFRPGGRLEPAWGSSSRL